MPLPAGDLTFAVGGDVRREHLEDTPDFANATGRTDQGGTPTSGGYNVKEAFIETLIPLAKNTPWAESMDVDAAARYTDYSVAGSVANHSRRSVLIVHHPAG